MTRIPLSNRLARLSILPAVAGLLFLAVPAASASICTQSPGHGIFCPSPTSYCGTFGAGGACMVEPVCPIAPDTQKTLLNCDSCSCTCPADHPNDCTAIGPGDDNALCQSTNTSVCINTRHRYSVCDNNALGSEFPADTQECGTCLPGYTYCGDPSQVCVLISPPSWCQPPDIWDQCTSKCSFKYLLANPTAAQAPQPATPSIQGSLEIKASGATDGNLYLPSGRRIAVNTNGLASLNLGNFDAGSTGFNLNVLGSIYSIPGISLIAGDDSVFPGQDGTLEAMQICFGDEIGCRTSWPVGLPEAATQDATLRYDGAVWKESMFLRNDESGIGIGVPTIESVGWRLDLRAGAGDSNAMMNLDDRVGNLWTGLRLGRTDSVDLNKERWFLGMDDSSNKLNFQYNGDIASRFLTIDNIGNVGISNDAPQDRLDVSNGSLRLERDDGGNPTVKLTETSILGRAWQLGLEANTGDFRISRSLANLDLPVLTLSNTGRSLGLNNATPGYPVDVWSSAGTAMMRLVQNTDTSLWTGVQLARKTTGDPNPVERWFIGMPDTAGGGDNFYIRRTSLYNDLTITPSGWVGINDDTPAARLSVSGNDAGIRVENIGVGNDPFLSLVSQSGGQYAVHIDETDSSKFKIGAGLPGSTTDRLVIDSAGRLGVNQSSPAQVVDVNGSASTGTVMRLNQNYAGNANLGLQLDRQASKLWFVGLNSTDDSFRVIQGGTPDVTRMQISNSGNVGIGVAPSAANRLEVNGKTKTASLQVVQGTDGSLPAAGSSVLTALDAAGNVYWGEKPVGLPTSGNINGQTLRYDGVSANAWVPTLNLYNNGSRIGINKSNPGYPLDIQPDTASTDLPMIRLNGPTTGRRWTGLRLDRAAGTEAWTIGMDDVDEDLIFRRAGSDNPLVIKSSTGNVGVNNTNPPASFAVGQEFRVDASNGHVVMGSPSNPVAGEVLTINETLNNIGESLGVSVDVNSTVPDGTNNLLAASFYASAEAAANVIHGVWASANNSASTIGDIYGGEFRAESSAGSPSNIFGVFGKSYVTGGSPVSSYAIRGEATGAAETSYGGYFSATGATVQSYGIYSANGNNYMRNWLAIGASNEIPQYPIDIYSDGGNAVIRLAQPTNTMRQGLRLEQSSAETWFIGMEAASNKLEFKTTGTTAMAVQTDGKVSINKATPDAGTTLDVAGLAKVNGFSMPTGAAPGLVLTSVDGTGEAYWAVVATADDCTGGKFHHLTASNYDGNRGGYATINGLCGTGPGGKPYHVCTAEDILRTIRCAPASLPAAGNMAWVSVGPPGFTAPATNDCRGWTTNNSAATQSYGSFWQFDGVNGGIGYATQCSINLPITCCTPL